MVNRRKMEIQLADGKQYVFSERNKEDHDFAALQDLVRTRRFAFLRKNVEDADQRLALELAEMKRFYGPQDVLSEVLNSPETMLAMAFDSFKLANKESFEQFKQLVKPEDIKPIYYSIIELEAPDIKKKEAGPVAQQ